MEQNERNPHGGAAGSPHPLQSARQCAVPDTGWEVDMNTFQAITGLCAFGLLVYLFVSLLKPEWFE